MCLIKIIISRAVEKNIKDEMDSALGNEYLSATSGNVRIINKAKIVDTIFPSSISLFIIYTRTQVNNHRAGINGAIRIVPPSDVARPLPP
jgi:hypothetical protein